ncbi:hypothetical protein RB598_002350 [Gaeumannomyces tritici]
MRPLLSVLSLSAVAQALYFYIDGTAPKCFFEELPKDTLVVGHYTAEEYDDHRQSWSKHDGLAIYISVDETFDRDHRVVSQKGSSGGRFTFTAAESGEHKLCFTPSSNSGKIGWLSSAAHNGGIRLTLDLAIGETSALESSDKDKLEDIATRIKDLNLRLQDIRREQVFQRVFTVFSFFFYLFVVFFFLRSDYVDKSYSLTLGAIHKTTGTRGRVPRPVRVHKRPRHPLDPHPAHNPGHHLRLAALTSEVFLHQAEAHLEQRFNQKKKNKGVKGASRVRLS